MFKWYKQEQSHYAYGCYVEDVKATNLGFIKHLIEYGIGYLKYKWCENKGHQLVDISEAGPETGNVHVYCKRCGYEDETILY